MAWRGEVANSRGLAREQWRWPPILTAAPVAPITITHASDVKQAGWLPHKARASTRKASFSSSSSSCTAATQPCMCSNRVETKPAASAAKRKAGALQASACKCSKALNAKRALYR